jgi:hypothetical protein
MEGYMHLQEGRYFIGVGNSGKKTAIELSRIYEEIREGLFIYDEHDKTHNHLQIHSYHCPETVCCDGEEYFIILAGSFNDSCLLDARKIVHDCHPYLMLTIGTNYQTGIDTETFQPFPDECLIVPDQSLFDPIAMAQLVLQIFLIHTPWAISNRGSLIGYDLADTKHVFAGKITKARKMMSDKEHYRQNFSKYLNENKADLSRSQSILMSLWGKGKVLSIPEANELGDEMDHLARPDGQRMFTFHILPDDGPDFMAIVFVAL